MFMADYSNELNYLANKKNWTIQSHFISFLYICENFCDKQFSLTEALSLHCSEPPLCVPDN